MQRLFYFLLIAGLAWVAGLFVFIAELPEPAGGAPKADGVVVFTGRNGERVTAAMTLLSDGAAKRLLISGVNPSVTRPDLAKLWPGDLALFDCCVDLGLQAQTTTGNATELDAWARTHGFSSLILVTSEFHMPRALVEAEDRLPEVTIMPYAVASGLIGPEGRPSTFEDWRRVGGEYSKFLYARAKTMLS
ncbi:MAG: YdcF family protein [Parvularculaceae bacterium]|nr:YdcF family protein [Parvularculaceae bacterium]